MGTLLREKERERETILQQVGDDDGGGAIPSGFLHSSSSTSQFRLVVGIKYPKSTIK